ncbi:hypothetical protein A1D29_01960 [Pasteurellaceae bacterium Orientalotternb1]|nr:hypothetical protein A1D29_01960 [Pasteurellaceae bacterium Orientalotternb1]
MNHIFIVLKKEILSIIALIISLISLFYVIKQDVEHHQEIYTSDLVEVIKILSTVKEHIHGLKSCLPTQSCSEFYISVGVDNFDDYLSLVLDNVDIYRKKIGDKFDIESVQKAIRDYADNRSLDRLELLDTLYPKVTYVQKNIMSEMKK